MIKTLKRLLRRIGEWQSAVLFSLLYLVLWIPLGLLSRLFADWLHRRVPGQSNWWVRQARLNDPAHTKEPF